MDRQYYQQYLTDKSFLLLTQLKKKYRFILIGGWAVYFYTRALKSKDIDIIIDFSELQKVRKDYHLEKNERLRKYQIKIEEIDIDIYLPHYSNLGILVEDIVKKTTVVNNFTLLKKEALFLTKLTAYKNRKSSVKGQKDLIDIISLACLPDFDFRIFKEEEAVDYRKAFIELLSTTKEIPEINLNRYYYSKKKKGLLAKL